VTWIRPDDLHTHPVVPESPKQQEEAEILQRRVSFHASVDKDAKVQQDRSLDLGVSTQGESTDESCRRIPVLVLIMLLCTIVVTASYMGWLPRGPLGSALFGEEAKPRDDMIPPKKVHRQRDSKPMEQVRPKIDISTHQRESVIKKEPPARFVVHETNPVLPLLPATQTLRETEKKDADEEMVTREQQTESRPHTPKLQEEELKPVKVEKKEPLMVETHTREITSPRHQKQSPAVEKQLPRKKGCLVPFAHLFSKKCRKALAQKPVYDMDALLNSLI